MATESAAKNGAPPPEPALAYADPKIRAYFTELDLLGEISRRSNNAKKPNATGAKVGARPVSGIRGVYFSKGMWRVNFLDDHFRVVSCLFKYEDPISLVRTYHLAHAFLRRVIELGRNVNFDDGTIIERLSDARIAELDSRRGRRSPRDSPEIRPKQITPYDQRQILDNLSYKRVKSRDRPNLNGDPDFDPEGEKKRKLASPKFLNGNGHIGRPRRLSKLEERLLEYSECSALEMVHRVIERNSQARDDDQAKSLLARRREREALRRELKRYEQILGKGAQLNGAGGRRALTFRQRRGGPAEVLAQGGGFTLSAQDLDREPSPNGTPNGSSEFEHFVVLSSGDDSLVHIKSYTFDNCFK